MARFYPERTVAQYDTAHNAIQIQDYRLAGGAEGEWEQTLARGLREIHGQAPNFRFYLAAGSTHRILPSTRFYTEEVNSIRFEDWVERLAEGWSVPNVRCDDCPDVAAAWDPRPACPLRTCSGRF